MIHSLLGENKLRQASFFFSRYFTPTPAKKMGFSDREFLAPATRQIPLSSSRERFFRSATLQSLIDPLNPTIPFLFIQLVFGYSSKRGDL